MLCRTQVAELNAAAPYRPVQLVPSCGPVTAGTIVSLTYTGAILFTLMRPRAAC